MTAQKSVAVRVTPALKKRIEHLAGRVRREGWKPGLNVERTDEPTLGAVIDVAIARLEARAMVVKNR